MPLLSFGAGLPDRFKDKLLNGEKLQTVREIRKDPIEKGEILYCWWKSRDPKRKQKLFDAVCTEVIPIEICPNANRVILNSKPLYPLEIEQFAIADGFNSVYDFYNYFSDYYGGRFNGVVIKFKLLEINWIPATEIDVSFDEPVAKYQGWQISTYSPTYSPNGGIVAVSISRKGEYWQASTDHLEAWHDTDFHVKIAKQFIINKAKQ